MIFLSNEGGFAYMRSYVGSFYNRLMEQGKNPKPVVGTGVTLPSYTDRYAGTIVEILSDKKIVIQEDKAIRTDNRGMSEDQDYKYERDPSAPKVIFRLRKNGTWVVDGQPMNVGQIACLGYRRAYHDFSF